MLNFATYANAIKKGIAKSRNIQITRLLLELITNDEKVFNKDGEPYVIKDHYSSLWWNNKQDLPTNIKKAAASPEIISKATSYFEENVLTKLTPQKEDDTYSTLVELISSDDSISSDTKDYLISLRKDNDLGKFLAETFLYSIQKDNKTSATKTLLSISDDLHKINDLLRNLPKPIEIVPQSELENHELKYTTALFEAFSDAENCQEVSKENLNKYPRYKKNFDRQRKNYYAAESIRRSARDTFGEDEINHFNLLKEETHNSILEVHEDYYDNAFERLNSVMKHVTTINLNKSVLTRIPGWISSNEKKGFCHMLVNDGKIKEERKKPLIL